MAHYACSDVADVGCTLTTVPGSTQAVSIRDKDW
jgi:hypothetical protein